MTLHSPCHNEELTLKPTQHIHCSHAANIHIDRIRIKAPCTHAPIGKVLYYDDEMLGEVVPLGATANTKALRDGGKKAYIRSKEIDPRTRKAQFIEIHCCPPLVLQKHNLFGHAVLQDYVYAILDLATHRLGIEVDPFDRGQWRTGGVSLTEIHLTANFACSLNVVLPIIDAIDENTSHGKQRPSPTCITLGLSKVRRSTYHALTIYDKYLELISRFKRPGPYQTKLLEEAKKGIRAEVKLYSQELTALGLGYVMRWRDINVPELYFRILNKYRIQYSIQRLLTEHELAILTRAERNAYLLWLKGIALSDQFGRTTAWKYSKIIEEKTGLDVSGKRRPDALPSIDLKEIFSPANILPVPDWAIGTEYYYPPAKRGLFDVPVDPHVEDELICLDGELLVI